MKKKFSCFCCLFLLIQGFAVFGENFNLWGSGETFKVNPVTDGILFGSGILLSGGDLLLDNVLGVNEAVYDSSIIWSKEDINPFDRKFLHQYNKKIDKISDAMLLGSLLTPAVFAATDKGEWATIAVMYAETLLISNGIKELTKLCVNRARPYMYFDPSTYPEKDVKDGDFLNSFPSGHSTMTFAAATFTTYVFCKYFSESNWKYAVAAGTYSLAVGTAILRVAGGNHFATDVITGAVLGSAVGFLVPWIHTFGTNEKLKMAVAPQTISFKINL